MVLSKLVQLGAGRSYLEWPIQYIYPLELNCDVNPVKSNTKRDETKLKGTVMQTEKALINNCLLVSKVFWKFGIPTIYNFTVIYLWNLLFSRKVAYFLTVSIVFSVCKQHFRVKN